MHVNEPAMLSLAATPTSTSTSTAAAAAEAAFMSLAAKKKPNERKKKSWARVEQEEEEAATIRTNRCKTEILARCVSVRKKRYSQKQLMTSNDLFSWQQSRRQRRRQRRQRRQRQRRVVSISSSIRSSDDETKGPAVRWTMGEPT